MVAIVGVGAGAVVVTWQLGFCCEGVKVEIDGGLVDDEIGCKLGSSPEERAMSGLLIQAPERQGPGLITC